MIALDLSNSVFVSAILDLVNFSESNVSGMNFAKFNLEESNFVNSVTCDTVLPWKGEKEKC